MIKRSVMQWQAVRTVLGPEARHAIAGACRLAAQQYRADMVTTYSEGSTRVSDQFHQQAIDCETIAESLEL